VFTWWLAADKPCLNSGGAGGGRQTSGAKRLKKILVVPLHFFGSTSTISGFLWALSCWSVQFGQFRCAVLLRTVLPPPCPAICKSEGHVPVVLHWVGASVLKRRCSLSFHHLLIMHSTRADTAQFYCDRTLNPEVNFFAAHQLHRQHSRPMQPFAVRSLKWNEPRSSLSRLTLLHFVILVTYTKQERFVCSLSTVRSSLIVLFDTFYFLVYI